MNKSSARNIREFVTVVARDGKGRVIMVTMPGHDERCYQVTIGRNSGLTVTCERVGSMQKPNEKFKTFPCVGNSNGSLCYHSVAAIEVTALDAGHTVLGWCESKAKASNLCNLDVNAYFTKVSSAQGTGEAYFVGVKPAQALTEWMAYLSQYVSDWDTISVEKIIKHGLLDWTCEVEFKKLQEKYPQEMARYFPQLCAEMVLRKGRAVLRGSGDIEEI